MFRILRGRTIHYALLVAVWAGVNLVNLGVPSLWDIDEGHNAEASREMLAADDWVLPTFNFQLRTDKPALLYWLQISVYKVLGVNELAARLPSALAGLGTIFLSYELGSMLYVPSVGLLAGLVLASTVAFCASAHFANPDALLTALTTLTLYLFALDYPRLGARWMLAAGAASGLAVLAKGPVGLALPAMVVCLFVTCDRRVHLLWQPQMLGAIAACAAVALPWYAWVAAETKFDFLRGFLLTHNVGRFRATMEGHSGAPYYYLVCFLAGFAPWSVFLGPVGWYVCHERRRPRGELGRGSMANAWGNGALFLGCWILVYIGFFTFSATKLPNYILPAYPAAALLTGLFLDRWGQGDACVPRWMLRGSLACLALVGATCTLGVVAIGGLGGSLLRGRVLRGLELCAWMGLLPVAGAVAAFWLDRWRRGVPWALSCVTVSAVLFVGSLAAWGAPLVDQNKAPRALAALVHADEKEPEIRVGCYEYYQPSLVFYCRREVVRYKDEIEITEFLRCPLTTYLFVPEATWQRLVARAPGSPRVLGRHYDLYQNRMILAIANR
jgi:4-amino-4-deoxy-L-arabinose transferase-like glycosyltransferase